MGKKLLKAVMELEDTFAKSDVMKMRILSNNLMEEAALENSRMMAGVALIGYCLHKLSTKEHIVGHGKWPMVKNRVLSSLRKAAFLLEKNNDEEFEKTLKGIVREITLIDNQIGNFVQGLYEKAMIKYAANAYSMGLSLSQAAELTGAEMEKVLGYVGVTRISDRERAPLGISERLKRLRKLM